MPNPVYPKNTNPKNTDPRNTAYYKKIKAEGIPYGQQSTFYQGKFMSIRRMEELKAQGGRHPGSGGVAAVASAVPGVPATTPTSTTTPNTVSLMGTPSPVVPLAPPVPVPVDPLARQAPALPVGFTPSPTSGTSYDPSQARQTPTVEGQIGVPPSWWNPNVYANPNAEQSFANAANAILPTLSPEDQRTMATYLATNFKDVYGSYANANFAPIPTQLTNERSTYLNPARAQSALGMLDKLKAASGGKELGTGYEFLRNAVNLLTKYSNQGSPMTREQYAEFTAAIKSMSASMGGDISAYKNLATLFNMPNFSAGQLVSNAPNAARLTQ